MKKLLSFFLILFACGKEPTNPPPVPTYDRQYVLSSLVYEDVVPGTYSAKLESLTGGPARMEFGDSLGQLAVDSVVNGTLNVTYPDSTVKAQSFVVLPKGNFEFSFTVNSTGAVKFLSGAVLWPMTSGAVLTDSTYTFDLTDCYNADCTDYVRFAFAWIRQF